MRFLKKSGSSLNDPPRKPATSDERQEQLEPEVNVDGAGDKALPTDSADTAVVNKEVYEKKASLKSDLGTRILTAAALDVSRAEEGVGDKKNRDGSITDRPPDVDRICAPLYRVMNATGMLPVFTTPTNSAPGSLPTYPIRRYVPIILISAYTMHVVTSTVALCIVKDSVLKGAENLNYILFLLSTLYTVYILFFEMASIRRFLREMTEFLSDLPDEQIGRLRSQMLTLLIFISIFNLLSLIDDLYYYQNMGPVFYFETNLYGAKLSPASNAALIVGRVVMSVDICIYEFFTFIALLAKMYYVTLARFLLYKIREYNERFSALERTKIDVAKVLGFLHAKFDRLMLFVTHFERLFSRLLLIWLAEIIVNLVFTFQNALAARRSGDLVTCVLNVLEFLFYSYMVGLTILTAAQINESVSEKRNTLGRLAAERRYVESDELRYLITLLRDKLAHPTSQITLQKLFPLSRHLILWCMAGLAAFLGIQYEVSVFKGAGSVNGEEVTSKAG